MAHIPFWPFWFWLLFHQQFARSESLSTGAVWAPQSSRYSPVCSGWELPEPPSRTSASVEKLLQCHLCTRTFRLSTVLPCSFISPLNLAAYHLCLGQNVLHTPLFCPSSVSHLLRVHKLWKTVSSASMVPSSETVSAAGSFPTVTYSWQNSPTSLLSFADQTVRKLLSSYGWTPLVASWDLHTGWELLSPPPPFFFTPSECAMFIIFFYPPGGAAVFSYCCGIEWRHGKLSDTDWATPGLTKGSWE